MSNTIAQLIEARSSTNFFDPQRPLAEGQLEELIRLACLAPSAFHMQNWRFIAVRTEAAKQALQSACFGQSKVTDAAVSIIICGGLQAHLHLQAILQPAVDAGCLDSSAQSSWVDMASKAHTADQQAQRDEAIRSASLAAMTLMLAAQGMGLASCPMGGFDAAALAMAFNLSGTDLPVMVITVGHAAKGNWQQKPRRPLKDVLAYA